MKRHWYASGFISSFALLVLCSISSVWGVAQNARPRTSYPSHLPYRFANFVWWSDDELRGLLKKRIPGLGDEIATSGAAEGKVRDALAVLLKEKGIIAEVQSMEPAPDALHPQGPDGPDFWQVQFPSPLKAGIEFSLLTPEVLIGKVILKPDEEQAWTVFQDEAHSDESRRFAEFGTEFIRYRAQEVLRQSGYLSGDVQLVQQPPRKDGDKFLVDLVLTAIPGPRYTIAAISADGGPLLQGRDLSRLFTAKVGDTAGRNPFGRLGGAIRAFYEHAGYPDVSMDAKPVLDQKNAQVSYHFNVIPGSLYHLRTLTVRNLNAEQESRVRVLLGMKSGDVFDQTAITGLYQKLPSEASLAGLSFGFSPARDKEAAVVDLTLNFYKQSDKSSVTIK